MPLLIGVDVGTSGCKVTAIDRRGTVVATASQSYPTRYPRPGWVEQGPQDWYWAACRAIQACLRAGELDPRAVAGLSIDGPAHNVALMDDAGKVLYPAIHWSDLRSTPQSERLEGRCGARIFAITCQRTHPSWTLSQLWWLKENEPQVWAQLRRIMAEDVRQFAAQSPAKTTARIDTSHPPRVNASPKARRLARELGVELAGLAGTGIGGMVTAQDVRAGLMRPVPVATRPSYTETAPSPAAAPIAAHPDVQPLARLQRAIARRMAASKQTVPHFYLVADADMTHVQQLRAYCRQTLGWERAPTYTDVIVRACALALAAMPGVNVVYTDEGLVQRHTVDIGVAVSTEAGLIVPVLPQADKQSLRQTSQRIRGLAERAGQGRLREGDLSPKSIVVSNLGMYGVDAFVAIIDPPDPMILAVGRVADRVVPVDGQPAVRPMCTLSLSVDHRALDGTQGTRFLARVKDMLENPFEILAEMQT